jgi:hypothetical protein
MTNIENIRDAKAGLNRAEEIVRQTRIELNKNKGAWSRLARISGGELTYPWIKTFAKGDITEPGISKAMILAKFLGIVVTAEEGKHFNRFE